MVTPPSKGTPNKDIDWLDTWKKMEEVYLANKDKVRAIGVCNRIARRMPYTVHLTLWSFRSPTSPSPTLSAF